MLFSSLSRRSFPLAVTTACSLCLSVTARADGDLRTVALTGDQVPGADPGVLFRDIFVPSLNALGQTAFHSSLTGAGVDTTNDSGIYSEGSGVLAEVARLGNQIPGIDSDAVFSLLGSPVLNAAGQTAFLGFLTGPGVNSTNNTGIYSDGGGTLAEVARVGNQAPWADPGVVFFVLRSPVLNSAGQTAFKAALTGTGVNGTNNDGIYSEGGGTLAEVARAGNQAPGADPGVVFSSFLNIIPVLNAAGQSAFFGELTGPDVNFMNNSGIYSERSGTLDEVARSGNQAPGADLGVVFRSFGRSPVLNAAGQTAFNASLTGTGVDFTNDRGIYSEGSGTLAEVTRAGNRAPGAELGVVFSTFDSPVLNAAGQTAFVGLLSGQGVGSTNNSGIYSEGSGTLAEVARAGNQAPGADPGVLFSSFVNIINISPLLNARGQSAFPSSLTGLGVDGTNDLGIYATDCDGLLIEIVREGNIIDVNDDPLIDDLRTISGLSMVTNTGNEDGRPSGFNDLGQLAFSATFTDGTSGVFISNRVAVTPVPGDFDLDGDIDGRDFLVWQRTPSVGNLADWQLNYGFDSSALSTASVVPEPATAALVALCLPVLLHRRNRK